MNRIFTTRHCRNDRPSSPRSLHRLHRRCLHACPFANDLAALRFAGMDAPRDNRHMLLALSGGHTRKGIHLLDRQTHPHAAASAWRHRIRNSLLLAACAEALADPLDGLRLPDPARVETVLHQRPPAPRRSAVIQAVIVAEHLGQAGGRLDQDEIAVALARQWLSDTGRDQTGTDEVLADITIGRPWRESAAGLYHGRGSYGNTAAVRAIACGLIPEFAVADPTQLARRAAVITHTHPLARDGAAAVAVAVMLAARDHPSPGPDTARFLAAVAGQLRCAEFVAALDIVRTLVRHRAGPAETSATVGSDHTALRSVPAALTAFLRHPHDPVAAIRYALLIGGNVKVTAAIAAALCGARHPQYEIPLMWRAPINTLRIHTAATFLATPQEPS